MIKVKEESEKVGLKLNIQKTKIMASGPITSWQIDGETVTGFIFLGSKITGNGDYRHEIKRCLLLGRKAMTNLVSILKSRDISLPIKMQSLSFSFSISPSNDYSGLIFLRIEWFDLLAVQGTLKNLL